MQTTDLALRLGAGLSLKRFIVVESDLTAAATSEAITLFTLKKGDAILGIRIKHSTAFAGGSVSAMTVSVGSTSAGAAGYASAFDIFQAVGATTFQMTSAFNAGTYADEATTATFTATGDNVVNLTAGQVEIDVLIMDVSTVL